VITITGIRDEALVSTGEKIYASVIAKGVVEFIDRRTREAEEIAIDEVSKKASERHKEDL
jgi:hypothetical protein